MVKLLIIDTQQDFYNPNGHIHISNTDAEKDAKKLIEFIKTLGDKVEPVKHTPLYWPPRCLIGKK